MALGMNAVVRAAVRTSLHYGHEVFAIQEGYQGLVDGLINQMTFNDVGLIIQMGGTIIGSARCMDFKQREGRLKAAQNLIDRNITNLICCGGDGSLTGANLFKNEWKSLLAELEETGRATSEKVKACADLNLIGLVGSIDNDMVYDGDLTIGTDTALHRIVECVDAVVSTASSHQRTFVLEVMGRHCGYLAWGTAVACGADFCILPEDPLCEDWETVLCDKLDKRRKKGRRMNLVVVAEGAIDVNGKDIKTEYICQVIRDRLHHDTRSTILGHVQRGGRPSAYDRMMATLTTVSAVEELLKRDPSEPAMIVGMKGTKSVLCPLVESVAETQLVAKYSGERNFKMCMKQRGPEFARDYKHHIAINGTCPKIDPNDCFANGKAIVIMHVGAPAAGMNSAVRAAVRFALNLGYTVYGAYSGFEGLEHDNLVKLDYMYVNEWTHLGGAKLGTCRDLPQDYPSIAKTLKKYNICGMILIGGFEGFRGLLDWRDHSEQHPDLKIAIMQIPATISNNVPGTDFSLGSDTAMNAVTDAIDRLKVSADSSRKRVFIVETQGANCGYLAATSALSSGAELVFTRERGVTLEDLTNALQYAKQRFENGADHLVFVRNEKCSPTYDIDFMYKLFSEEGKGLFSVRKLVLGHLCQGLHPSPLDRIRAMRTAACAMDFLNENLVADKHEIHVVGQRDGSITYQNISSLEKSTDVKARIPKNQWFMNLLPVFEKLAKSFD